MLVKIFSTCYTGCVSKRDYGQYCGMARALEVIGERWAVLIIRDLLIGAKRFSDLQRGLPGIPTNVLTARLKEFEEAGIVRRVVLPRPASGLAYELTDSGRQLEEPLIAIGRWGALRLGDPRPDEVVTVDSIASALCTTFRPERASGLNATFLLKLGEIEVTATVKGGEVCVQRGAAAKPDLTIEAGPALRQIMAQEVTPAQAIESGLVRLTGDAGLFDAFASVFRI
jgi:DNA-binding HxlR family transcriptional regulator